MSKKINTIFIVGPTASGKTALSIEVAKKFNGEIISADSMQLYKGIHIASAAPDEDEKCGIPHHLIEFLETDDEFSVADYVKRARECIFEIANRGKLPFVVGGTGLYINALLDNIEFVEQDVDLELRSKLEERFDKIGAEEMLSELAKFDLPSAQRLNPNNRRRIIRAFEIYLQTGETMTRQNENSKRVPSPFNALVIGITYEDREKLYERINKRVEIMLQNNLLEEAKTAFERSNSKGGYQAIGHKELYKYFEGNCTLEQATEELKKQTRHYAKRQLTWFGRDMRINWIYADKTENVTNSAFTLINEFLETENV